MRALRHAAASALLASVLVAGTGCGSDGDAAVDPRTTVAGAFDEIGGDWVPAEQPWRGPGPWLASTCGAPDGLGRALDGSERRAVSAVRTKRFDPGNGGPPVTGLDLFVRVAAVRYPTDIAAAHAVTAVTSGELEQCVTRAVNEYLHEQDFDPDDPVAPATVRSFDTHRVQRPVGSLPAILQSSFEEEVVGGYDNSRSVNLAVGRSGRVVVTVVSATGAQSPDPGADARAVGRSVGRLVRSLD